ncbi:LuxR family transcriptional regulator [Pseudomonas cedrina]|uniref:LuxR family transcriptional regulator n=1 Tax=Pseudomonas cedrina TaxID=651740 RepID=UPI003EDAC2F5
MRQTILDYYEKLMYCKEENIFSELVSIANLLGFDYVSYVVQSPLPTVKPKTYMFENYPASWINHYQNCAYFEIDPVIRLGRVTNQPFIWTEDLFQENKFTKKLWAEAKKHGLNHGISHPLWDTGSIFGLLSLSRAKGAMSKLEVQKLQVFFDCIGSILHRRISSQCLRSNDLDQIRLLTPKEQEVLRWSADGKTVPELAIIMNISERTVSFHVTNILEKLKVTSKIQAAVIMASINQL